MGSRKKRGTFSLCRRVLRGMVLALLGGIGLVAGAGAIAGCLFSVPAYEGPLSAHFNGKRFHNQDTEALRGFRDFLKWSFSRDRGEWERLPDRPPGPPPPRRLSKGELRLTLVNHSTFLIQMDGLNILTDPVWSERASPVSWAGPRRVRSPGIRIEDLPEIDIVLISHNHYDHLDVPTLRHLAGDHAPRIFTGLGNTRYLEEMGVGNSTDLDWWHEVSLSDSAHLIFVPAQHFSGRGLFDRNTTLWGGFVIRSGSATVFFAGDTGLGPHFREIRERFGPPDLAILPIGAYLPRWFMSKAHLCPEEALEVHRMMEARVTAASHFGTFPLADDSRDQPEEELRAAMDRLGISSSGFWVLECGEGRSVVPGLPEPIDPPAR